MNHVSRNRTGTAVISLEISEHRIQAVHNEPDMLVATRQLLNQLPDLRNLGLGCRRRHEFHVAVHRLRQLRINFVRNGHDIRQ